MILVAALGFAGIRAYAQHGRALDAEAITSLITGNTFRGAYRARQLTMVFYPDGVVRGSLGLTGSDDGRWEVADDLYCHEWVRYFGSVRRCYRWRTQGDGYLLENVDAFRTFNITGRIERGKPEGY